MPISEDIDAMTINTPPTTADAAFANQMNGEPGPDQQQQPIRETTQTDRLNARLLKSLLASMNANETAEEHNDGANENQHNNDFD